MSVRKLAAGLISTICTFGLAGSLSAQDHSPLVDPFAFDPQYRWFEPVYDIDLEELKPEKRAPNGWFATYDRLNLYGSRPETNFNEANGGETKLDSGWGHRYELGYMLPHEDTGWTFTYTDNDVTNIFLTRTEAPNRFLDLDNADGSVTVDNFGRIRPEVEDNRLGFATRFYEEGRTLNMFNFDSYELNKTWRLTPYHYGGILEPFVGFRFMTLDDRNSIIDVDTGADLTDGTLNIGLLGIQDTVITQTSETDNEMFTGQVGFRYMKQRARFTYSSDFRVFAGPNYQCANFTTTTFVQAYGDTPADTTVDIGEPGTLTSTSRTEPVIERNEEFVVGFDLRGEVGYQVSRMIQLRAGFQLIDIGTGVWRGGSENTPLFGDQDQDVVMLGGTFGISLNH